MIADAFPPRQRTESKHIKPTHLHRHRTWPRWLLNGVSNVSNPRQKPRTNSRPRQEASHAAGCEHKPQGNLARYIPSSIEQDHSFWKPNVQLKCVFKVARTDSIRCQDSCTMLSQTHQYHFPLSYRKNSNTRPVCYVVEISTSRKGVEESQQNHPLAGMKKMKNTRRFTTKGNYNDTAHRPCIRVFTVVHLSYSSAWMVGDE